MPLVGDTSRRCGQFEDLGMIEVRILEVGMRFESTEPAGQAHVFVDGQVLAGEEQHLVLNQ